jgi:hypothetical protein
MQCRWRAAGQRLSYLLSDPEIPFALAPDPWRAFGKLACLRFCGISAAESCGLMFAIASDTIRPFVNLNFKALVVDFQKPLDVIFCCYLFKHLMT